MFQQITKSVSLPSGRKTYRTRQTGIPWQTKGIFLKLCHIRLQQVGPFAAKRNWSSEELYRDETHTVLALSGSRISDHLYVSKRCQWSSEAWSSHGRVCWTNEWYQVHGVEKYWSKTTDSVEVNCFESLATKWLFKKLHLSLKCCFSTENRNEKYLYFDWLREMYISGNTKALAEGNTVHKLLTRCQEKSKCSVSKLVNWHMIF